MSASGNQYQDELEMGLNTIKKNILSLQSFIIKTLPPLKGPHPESFTNLNYQANALVDDMRGVQRMFTQTISYLQGDLNTSGVISARVLGQIDACRNKLSTIVNKYEFFVGSVKTALSQDNPSVVRTMKVGAQTIASTTIEAAAKVGNIISKTANVVQETGQNLDKLSVLVPYLPYIGAAAAVLYLSAFLPRPRRG